MANYKPIFTTLGSTKIANAIANNTHIVLDTMALGDASSDLNYVVAPEMTALKDEKIRIKVRNITMDDTQYFEELVLKIFAIMLPAEAIDMTIREIGIYDNAGDLIMITRSNNITTKTPEALRTGVNIKLGKRISINALEVFKINPIGNDDPVSRNELLDHISQEVDPHKTTKAQAGLGNVEDIPDVDYPISNVLKDLFIDSKLANGFVNRESSSIERTSDNVITLVKHVDIDIYKNGIIHTITNSISFDVVDDGEYYIGINLDNNTLYKITTLNIGVDIPVAYIIRNSTQGVIYLSDERHLCSLNTEWYKMQDNMSSISWLNGGVLDLAVDGDTDVGISISSPILMANKDLFYSIMHDTVVDQNYEQNLVNAILPVLYIGAGNKIMESKNVNGLSWLYNGTRAVFNNTVTGTLGTINDKSFVNYFLIYTSDIKAPVKLVIGNVVYDKKSDAVAADVDNYAYILSRVKCKKIAKITLETSDNYTGNAAKIKVVHIEDLASNTGLRQTFTPSSHDDLGDSRFKPDQHGLDNIEGLADTIDGVGLIKSMDTVGNITGSGVIDGDTLVIDTYQADTRVFPYLETSVYTDVIGGSYTNIDKYTGIALALNGKLYCSPYSNLQTQVLEIDPSNATTALIGTAYSTAARYFGIALAPNGNLYCAPFNATQVLEINPYAKTTALIGTTYAATGKWAGVACAKNGKLYCAPSDATQFLEIDPIAKTTTTFGTADATVNKYVGIALGPNGLLYAAPSVATRVMEIDPVAKTATPIGNVLSGGTRYRGICLGPDGMMYCAPYGEANILVINPYTKETTTFPSIAGGMDSIVLAPNGKMYCAPVNGSQVLEIDPIKKTTRFVGTEYPAAGKYIGMCLAADGNMYASPSDAVNVLKIQTFPKSTDFGSYLLTAQFKP